MKFFALFCIVVALFALSPQTIHANDAFLEQAVVLAQESQRTTSVPASVTLAQAIWETGRGSSPIGNANNYFGIKASARADGSINTGEIATGWVWAQTKEWDGKRYVERRERFRTYATMADSFRDHGLLLATAPRYADAMRVVDEPREFARRIAAAGYATSPTYARDLIAVMDREDLYRFDLPRNAAAFVGQSEYLTVMPGEIFQVYFDVRNDGFGTWSGAADYYLASVNPNRFSAAPRHTLDGIVSPGQSKRWVLSMVAPQLPGSYRTAWQLKHGALNFGPELYIQVQVADPSYNSNWRIGLVLVALGGVGIGAWLWSRRSKEVFPRLPR